jgi:ankyrin repeat protein
LYHNVPLDVTDVLGRTPLHIAVLHASTEAIPVLTNGSTAALIQDQCHRCPLHWACTYHIGYNQFQSRNTVSDAASPLLRKLVCQSPEVGTDMCDAVRVLLKAYPEATLVRDADDQTPLEIARQHNADPSIIRMVQQVEQSIRREHQNWCDVWGESHNGDTTSMTLTESISFPEGLPGEITYRTRTVYYPPSNPSSYSCFEC